MATLFNKLPLEVRNQIYEELLAVGKHFFVVDEPSVHKTKSNLYPAILSTCRQAYHEASAVLYGQNHLRYTKLASSAKDGLHIAHLEKIRHVSSLRSVPVAMNPSPILIRQPQLEVAHSSIAMRTEQSAKLNADLETVNHFTTAIKCIATCTHSFKTLRLVFLFSYDREVLRRIEDRSSPIYRSANIVAKYARNQDLQNAISDLRVRDKIIVETESFRVHDDLYEHMVEFVNKVGSLKKGWAVTGRYQNWAQSHCEEEIDSWAWVLEPLTTATEEKGTDDGA